MFHRSSANLVDNAFQSTSHHSSDQLLETVHHNTATASNGIIFMFLLHGGLEDNVETWLHRAKREKSKFFNDMDNVTNTREGITIIRLKYGSTTS